MSWVTILWTMPLWKLSSPETSRQVRMGSYERLFDEGHKRVRAWEAANVTTDTR